MYFLFLYSLLLQSPFLAVTLHFAHVTCLYFYFFLSIHLFLVWPCSSKHCILCYVYKAYFFTVSQKRCAWFLTYEGCLPVVIHMFLSKKKKRKKKKFVVEWCSRSHFCFYKIMNQLSCLIRQMLMTWRVVTGKLVKGYSC